MLWDIWGAFEMYFISRYHTTSDKIRDRFMAEDITLEKLNGLLGEYAAHTDRGDLLKVGWPKLAYAVSKLAVCRALIFNRENLFHS